MMIELQFLDHVAIYVKSMERSAEWYQSVFGMKKHQLPEWGAYPIFMLSGKFGVAIFPADSKLSNNAKLQRAPHINHFAFNVDSDNFAKAQDHYKNLGIHYRFADHHYYQSIYISDPDDHIVELTTQVKDF